MLKLEDILVWTNDHWLSSVKETLSVGIWETFLSHWKRKFPHIILGQR